MTLRISGRHMDIGDAFRANIEERINAITSKYFFDAHYSGHVTVVKSRAGYSADCILHLGTGVVLQTTGQSQDPRLAFDAAANRMETRLRRYKSQRKSHQGFPAGNSLDDISHQIIEPVPDEDEALPEDYAPTIVAETPMMLRVLSVAAAVVELDLVDHPVLVFRNAADNRINIVYRRRDGNIGWIDPLAAKQTDRT